MKYKIKIENTAYVDAENEEEAYVGFFDQLAANNETTGTYLSNSMDIVEATTEDEIVPIGNVGVDSGQLLICDPCYIDSEWKDEELSMKEILIFPDGKEVECTRADKIWFKNIDDINKGKIKVKSSIKTKSNFSYAACCERTLSEKGFGQLNYKLGHPGVGVVSTSGWGDGVYPVFAAVRDYKEKGGKRVIKLIVELD